MTKVSRLNNVSKETKSSKWLAIVLALQVPLGIYIIPGTTISFYFFVIIFSILVTFAAYNKHLRITTPVVIFTLMLITLNLMSFIVHKNESWYNGSVVINNTIFLMVPFLITMTWFENRLSMHTFLGAVTIIALLASGIAVYQRLSFMATGSFFNNWFIPGLETSREDVAIEAIGARPSAFFTEPSHLAQYLLPVALYHLQKRNIWQSIVLVLGILASGSTNGLVGLVLILLLSFFLNGKQTWRNVLLFVTLIALFAWLYTSESSFLDAGLEKLENTDDSNIRLLGSTIIFKEFDLTDWLLGLGHGNRTSFLVSHGLLQGGEYMYANTYFGILSSFGIIGMIVFIWFVFKLYLLCTKKFTSSYLLLFLVLCASVGMLFSGYMIYYLTFIINSNEITIAQKN